MSGDSVKLNTRTVAAPCWWWNTNVCCLFSQLLVLVSLFVSSWSDIVA